MGLDGVEIVMMTEETFGIEIPNAVAQRLLTPADLVNYIAAQVTTLSVDACQTQQLFYRLRRGFRRQVAALSQTFEPDTPLADILHEDQWDAVWAAVRADVGSDDWPARVQWPGLLAKGPKTVRQLVWHLVEQLPRPRFNDGEAWTRAMIEAQVRRIVYDVTGKVDFRLRANFVKEIGID